MVELQTISNDITELVEELLEINADDGDKLPEHIIKQIGELVISIGKTITCPPCE